MQELGSTKTYKRTSSDEKAIVDNHCYHITTKFAVGIKENQEHSGYLNFINDLIKHISLKILVHAQPLNCLNC